MSLALITGPTAGIGRAFADALAAVGHDLVLVSRDKARLESVANELQTAYGVRTEVLPADLSDPSDTRRIEERLASEPFAVLVNNAGFGMKRPFHDNDIADEQAALDVLVTAVMRLTHAALGPMLAAGHGEIVNVSSVAGYLPRGTYGAHKAWVTSFSSWANVRYRKRGVRVMAVCPGFVRTEFHQRLGTTFKGTPGWMILDAEPLVKEALGDLRAGKAVSVPTFRYKILVALARGVPRPILERIARRGR